MRLRSDDVASDDSLCPLCWGEHSWTKAHEIVAMAPREEELMLSNALARLGVGWPSRFDRTDPEERSGGVLRMIEEAARFGFDCDAVGDRWIVSRAKQRAVVRVAA